LRRNDVDLLATAFKNKEQNPSTFARSALDVVKLNADDAFLKRFVTTLSLFVFCSLRLAVMMKNGLLPI